MKHQVIAALASGALAAVASAAVSAADSTGAPAAGSSDAAPAAASQRLQQVVVTATRRTTNLETTPVSISALTATQLQVNHVENLSDVTQLTPSLVYMPRGGSEGYLSLRGAIIFDDSPGTDPAVSLYVDDVVRVSVADVQPDIYDVNRVEVLKGPQGTLFGRNSIGGVVAIYTNDPTFTRSGKAEVTYGDHDLAEFKGEYNLPLVDQKLAGRITIASSSVRGDVKDIVTHSDLNGEHRLATNGKLLFTPTDTLRSVLGFDYLHKQGTQAEWLLGDYVPSLLPGLTYNPEQSAQSTPGSYGQTNWGLTDRTDWTLAIGTLTSITGYRHLDSTNTKTLFPDDVFILDAYEHDHQITQELRLSSPTDQRLSWIAGLYFLHNYKDRPTHAIENYLAGSFFAHHATGYPAPILYDNNQMARTTSAAPYIDLQYRITRRLKLDVGGRYTWQRKSGTAYLNSTGGLVGGANLRALERHSWKAVTPSVTLSYMATNALMTYIKASRGFLSGGFNASSSTDQGLATPFDSEYVWNYELGAKFNGLNDRLRMNVAAFHDRYANLQVIQLDETTLQVITTNAGAANVDGVELDMQGAPTNWLTLGVSYDYLHSVFTRFMINNGDGTYTNNAGNQVPFAPPQRVTATLDFHFPLSLGVVTFGGDYTYRSPEQLTAQNYGDTPQQIVDLTAWRGLVNLHADWTSDSGRWQVQLWGKNVTNLHYAIYAQSAAIHVTTFPEFVDPTNWFYEIQPGPYRSFGLTLRTWF